MNITTAIVLPLLIGVIAGLRAMTAPAAISLAARAGRQDLTTTPLAFLGYAYTPWIFTVLALVELVTDQLPTTPSRTVPIQFGTRIIMGGLTGGAIGAGAIVGTLGGRAVRARLAAAFGSDRPAAVVEDAIAVGGAFLIAGVWL